MSEELATVTWELPSWSETVLLPKAWAAEVFDPDERGQFRIVHCGNYDTAVYVRDVLNKARIRAGEEL